MFVTTTTLELGRWLYIKTLFQETKEDGLWVLIISCLCGGNGGCGGDMAAWSDLIYSESNLFFIKMLLNLLSN